MKKLKWGIFFLIFPLISNGQNLNLQQLLNEAFVAKVFIYAKPITRLNFDDPKYRSRFTDYIDSSHYQQLVANIKKVDSSLWTDQELRNLILVSDDEPVLQWDSIKQKFNLDKKEEEWYKSGIDYYNKHPQKRLIYRVSRPIFDDNKELAVFQYQFAKDRNDYDLSLFRLTNGVWEEVFFSYTTH